MLTFREKLADAHLMIMTVVRLEAGRETEDTLDTVVVVVEMKVNLQFVAERGGRQVWVGVIRICVMSSTYGCVVAFAKPPSM